jgi:sarcosine oxidase subunit alpha
VVTPNGHGARRLDEIAEPVSIWFDGVPLEARAGEPLIIALLAAGVRVLRKMPHHGEARGGFCLSGRCSDCLMIVDDIPGTLACTTVVRDGMRVETQHGHGRWPEGARRS